MPLFLIFVLAAHFYFLRKFHVALEDYEKKGGVLKTKKEQKKESRAIESPRQSVVYDYTIVPEIQTHRV